MNWRMQKTSKTQYHQVNDRRLESKEKKIKEERKEAEKLPVMTQKYETAVRNLVLDRN